MSCPVNFAKFLRTRFIQNTCGQLLVVLRSKFNLLSKSCSFLCTVLELESRKNVLHCLCRSETNNLRLNNLTTENTTKAKLSRFVIYIEVIIYSLWEFY